MTGAHLDLRGDGVAVLPEYFVTKDLKAKKLVKLMPKVKLLTDHFRLVFRSDDPRRSSYTLIAETMLKVPLR